MLGDTIHLAIRGRLSELDSGHMVRVGQQTVPGVRVREFGTRTEMKSGQTFAMTKLIQTVVEAESRGVPFVSEVPYAGAMFKSVKEERRRNSDVYPRAAESSNRLRSVSFQDRRSKPLRSGSADPSPGHGPGLSTPAIAHRPADGDTRR